MDVGAPEGGGDSEGDGGGGGAESEAEELLPPSELSELSPDEPELEGGADDDAPAPWSSAASNLEIVSLHGLGESSVE